MKKVILICVSLLMSNIFAQDKAMLTKEETVNYINKKMQEAIGLYKTGATPSGQLIGKEYYWEHYIELSGDVVRVHRSRSNYTKQKISDYKSVWHTQDRRNYKLYPCDYYRDFQVQEFYPKDISSIELYKNPVSGESVGAVNIFLKSKTNKSTVYRESAKFQFPYDTSIKYEYQGECYGEQTSEKITESNNYAYINFLLADETNFNKLKKAFEHLRDLCKAEDDPFGE